MLGLVLRVRFGTGYCRQSVRVIETENRCLSPATGCTHTRRVKLVALYLGWATLMALDQHAAGTGAEWDGRSEVLGNPRNTIFRGRGEGNDLLYRSPAALKAGKRQ